MTGTPLPFLFQMIIPDYGAVMDTEEDIADI